MTLSIAVVVSLGMTSVRPALAAKTDCVNAHTRTSGTSTLSLYQKPGCKGFSLRLSKGYSAPDVHLASAKVE